MRRVTGEHRTSFVLLNDRAICHAARSVSGLALALSELSPKALALMCRHRVCNIVKRVTVLKCAFEEALGIGGVSLRGGTSFGGREHRLPEVK